MRLNREIFLQAHYVAGEEANRCQPIDSMAGPHYLCLS